MPFILKLEHLLFLLSFTTPLELFTLIGSFVEEIIPPIPSSLITLSAGGMLAARKSWWITILWLAMFSAIGKSLGATIIYFIAAKTQTALITRFGKYLKITEKDIESFSKRFGKGWRDDVTLFVLRSIPLVPSFTVSIGSGILRLNFKTYILATFFGTIIRDGILISIGYAGLDIYKKMAPWVDSTGTIIFSFLLIAVLISVYIFIKKRKHQNSV
jgi:membrane protein DedA with SNARE-associated domain